MIFSSTTVINYKPHLNLALENKMALKTVKDFDFGMSSNIRMTDRVSSSPSDVSKIAVDFIVWLILEQEFRKSKRLRQTKQQHTSVRRTQTDGFKDDDEDDGDEIDRPIVCTGGGGDMIEEKMRIARKYAEQTLIESGKDNMLWQDLSDQYREKILLQLCKNCDLVEGSTKVQSVPEMYARLRCSKFQSTFSVKKLLAKGGFGEVYLVSKDGADDKLYAMKKITPYECESFLDDVKAACNESAILKLLKGHKNIVEIYDYWLEIEPNTDAAYISTKDDEYEEGPLKFYIQLEYCSDSLDAWKESNYKRGVVPEKSEILNMALQIFDGLAYIHKKGILHLDINPKNILWKDPTCTQIKIIDFGLARQTVSHSTKDGTVGYIAPETPLTQKSDVYSATVTTIEVAKTIYTKTELNETIQQRKIDIGIPALDKLLHLALDENPLKRPSAIEIVEKLSQE